MTLTLAEELLLLALDDRKGSALSTNLDTGLAGAILVDLGHRDALRVADRKVQAVQGAPLEHPVLVRAHAAIAASDKARSPKSWLSRLPRELKPIADTVAAPLVEHGVITEERGRFLGLFPTTRYPEADPGPERQLRTRLREVLVAGREPAEHDALLIGLLAALDLVGPVVERDERRAARKRAKEVADTGIAGSAVRDVVQDVQVAVITAVVASGAVGGSE